MTQSIKYLLLGCLEEVYNKIRKSRLKDPSFGDIGQEMDVLCDYFKVNRFQAAFLSILFDKGHDGETVSFDEVFRHFDCSALRLLKFQDDLADLVERNFGAKKSTTGFQSQKDGISVKQRFVGGGASSKPLPELLKATFEDVLDVLGTIADLDTSDDVDEIDLLLSAGGLVSDNLHFHLWSVSTI